MADPTNTLTLNGHLHDLNMVIKNSHAAPRIDVDVKTINSVLDGNVNPEHIVTIRSPEEAVLDSGEVIVFKQNAGFTVLLGKATLSVEKLKGKKVIKARLISTPVLKKCRVQTAIPVREERQPYYTDNQGYANRPRFRDEGYASNPVSQGGYRRNEVPVFSGAAPARQEGLREYRPSSTSYDDHQARLNRHARSSGS